MSRQSSLSARVPVIAALVCAIAAATLLAQAVPVEECIQAEDYDGASGGISMPDPAGLPFKAREPMMSVICGAGQWLRFGSINFLGGEYDSLYFYCWTVWEAGSTRHTPRSGDAVVVRLDSVSGPMLARIQLTTTQCYFYETSDAFRAGLARATGLHSVFLTFEGQSEVCRADRFYLKGAAEANAADAHDYYVAPNGDDRANDGLSVGAPFRTIQKAASVMKPGSRCLIRQGIYRETVKPPYTGLPGAPLTFEAYNGELVYVDGADPITGWTAHSGSIYKATMPQSLGKYRDQILVDGEMAWPARCPNVEEDYAVGCNYRFCGGAHGPNDYRNWHGRADPMSIGTEVCFGTNGSSVRNASGPYGSIDFDVSQNSNTQNLLPARLFGRPANFFKGGLISVDNLYWRCLGEITASSTPSATRTVFVANAWNSVRTDENGPGFVSYLFSLLDSPNEWYRDSASNTLYLWAPDGGDPSHHLVEAKRRICGFDLQGKQYVTVKGMRFVATSMTLADAANCTVDNCHFKYVSYFAVFDWYEQGFIAYMHNCPWNPTSGYSGIYVSGHDNVIKNSSVAVSSGAGIILAGTDNTVTNCHIHDCNQMVTSQAGILVFRRDETDPDDGLRLVVSHNTLMYNARSSVGVSACMQSGTDRLRILYNEFGPAAYTSQETGSIDLQMCPKAEVAYNWFYGVAGLNQGDIVPQSDFGARGAIVHHNVFWQGEAIVGCGFKTGCHWTFDPSDADAMIFNNTVVDSSDVVHRDWDMLWVGYCPTSFLNKNNIWCMSDTVPWKFTDGPNRDYTLRAGSPAIDKGVVVPGWVDTYKGSAPDQGAYEFGEPRWVAGADWQEQPWVYPPTALAVQEMSGMHAAQVFRGRLLVLPHALRISGPANAAYDVAVFDARGSVVRVRHAPKGGALLLDMQDVNRGVYLIRASFAGGSKAWKVLYK